MQTTTTLLSTPVRDGEAHRIWINTSYYLRVDSEGFIMGMCYEGALGCVIPLLSAYDGNRLALKIPRMLADTVRENAFISQVVSAESGVVYRANEEFHANSGLIPVQAYGRDVLRGVRELRNAPDIDARRQDGCVLMFSFRKDRNPRVLAVKFEGERRVVFPPDGDAVVSFLTRAMWERLCGTPDDDGDAGSYYFEVERGAPSGAAGEVMHAPLLTTMAAHDWPEVWFGALPSILYNWAGGTLQEAVSQGRLRAWSVDQHYALGCRVLRGVDTLHAKRFIHGDLRPANIMTCGAANTPDDYVVGDYGSFSEDFSQVGGPTSGSTGHTMVGGLGRHRTSVFYAPERRAGVERETADVAVILSALDDEDVRDEYLIFFGWRSQLLDPRTNNPNEGVVQALREQWRRMLDAARDGEAEHATGERLTRGDRLRVREFIFTVIDAEEFEDPAHASVDDETAARRGGGKRTVFRCHARFAQVLHERITVYNVGPKLADVTIIGLPNFVELRQWSAATDLYGAGALILYTVFMSGIRGSMSATALAPQPDAPDDTANNAETLLAQMLEMLEGIPSFLALWSDLEDFCWTLEHADHAALTGVALGRVEVRHRQTFARTGAEVGRVDAPHVEPSGEPGDPGEPSTLGGFALRTVNNLLRSVPNIRCVLQAFQCGVAGDAAGRSVSTYNAANFLLFVHFVMACLHRCSHLRNTGEGELRYPFCRDRCDPAVPGGPAAEALARLEELRRRLLQPRYEAIVVHDTQLVDFDPRDVMQIRIEHAQLVREVAIRRRDVGELQLRLDETMARLGQSERSCSESQDEIERSLAELRELQGGRAAATLEAERLRGDLATARAAIAESTRRGADTQRDQARLELELAARMNAVDALESKVREYDLEAGRLAAEVVERDGQLCQLRQRSDAFERGMQTLMENVRTSMEHCLVDLDAVRQGAWRVPQDRVERLMQALTLWRDWGARRRGKEASQPAA